MPELTIRKDRTPVMLRKLANAAEDARVARRMLAIANALDGMSRKAAAEAAGMDRQTQRDWVIRYNEDGIDGLLDRWGSGRPPRLEPDELAEVYAIVMAGPDPEIDGICAFTREDLVRICEQRFDKTMHRATMGRLLRSIGLSRQKARPSHPQKDPASQEAFKARCRCASLHHGFGLEIRRIQGCGTRFVHHAGLPSTSSSRPRSGCRRARSRHSEAFRWPAQGRASR